MEDRIIDLEQKYSFQEDLVSQLSDIVARQQQQLDNHRLLLDHLAERLAALEHQGQVSGTGSENDKPPHY